MELFDRKEHWETIYSTKQLNEVSWYQPTPEISLKLIEHCALNKNAKIIDVGGGDSFLVDHLIDLGYTNITVLDISERSIIRAKKRLGEKANNVNWIVSDVVEFTPTETYSLWHDRAVFHFLNEPTEIEKYQRVLGKSVDTNGNFIIGTFSKSGPLKCSGIEITQYGTNDLVKVFESHFDVKEELSIDHETPFSTVQNFSFCRFKRKS